MKLLLRLIFLSFLIFSSIAVATFSDTSSAWASGPDDDDDDDYDRKSGDDDDDDDDDKDSKYNYEKFRPLSSVIREFNRSGIGRFLDVKIADKKGIYYYKITYIRPNGKVGKAYYPASKVPNGKSPSRPNKNSNKSRD